MACGGAGSYDQQRLAYKKFKLKKANQFKTNFIALWEKYGEFQDVDGVRCFAGYRIDGDGVGQKKMSRRLQQPNLWQETDDKHFDWVKLYFNLAKLNMVTDADVDAFFTYYKGASHNRDADRFHYKFEIVTEPNDYGYYTTDKVVTEHWFERKIITIVDGVEVITWEKIEEIEDEFLFELSWELADLALDSAIWQDPNNPLVPITEIVMDIELTEAELDVKIDELRATEFAPNTDETVYKVVSMGDKIRDYTLEQSVGGSVLDDLEYVSYFGADGQYYLSVDAAKKMNGEVFLNLVVKTMDFNSELKSKYKWRKRLLSIVAIVASLVALFYGQPQIAASIMLGYIGGTSNNKTIQILTQIASIAMGGAGGLSSLGASEAIALILNVASLYLTMQTNNSAKIEPTENADEDQKMFYKMPYDIYDEIYCYESLISVTVETS